MWVMAVEVQVWVMAVGGAGVGDGSGTGVSTARVSLWMLLGVGGIQFTPTFCNAKISSGMGR